MRKLDRNNPVVDQSGRPLHILQIFSEEVSRLEIISGSGSPEGVVSSPKRRLYMNESGIPGGILYIKQLSDIGGDASQGWVAVG